MPLLVTDYSWTQTDSTVYINVPLKGVKVGKVDILSTDEYLKVTLANKVTLHFVSLLLYVAVRQSIYMALSTVEITTKNITKQG